jgi:hypothetical protein
MHVVDLFLQCCERFLAADGDFLQSLRQHGFDCDESGWNFTLPQLHGFLLTLAMDIEVPAYVSFRQQLFNSPVNTRLAQQQARIVIASNSGKVDLTVYRLQRT